MADILIVGTISIISIFVSCFYLKFDLVKEKKSISGLLPQNKKQTAFGVEIIASVLLMGASLVFLYDASWVFAIKRVILGSILWPIALIDKRKHIIPNKILLFLLIIRSLIAIVELIYDIKTAKFELLSCLIASVGILILLCLMRLIVKDGLGFGDIKLFAVMGLYLGVAGTITTVFVCFVISFLEAIFLLLTKRKNKKDQIAFAPAILIGTFISVLVFGA